MTQYLKILNLIDKKVLHQIAIIVSKCLLPTSVYMAPQTGDISQAITQSIENICCSSAQTIFFFNSQQIDLDMWLGQKLLLTTLPYKNVVSLSELRISRNSRQSGSHFNGFPALCQTLREHLRCGPQSEVWRGNL